MIFFVIVDRDRTLQYDVLRSVLSGSHGVWSSTRRTLVHVEQTPGAPFNRGLLFNVGFLLSNASTRATHVVFHDADMIPESTMAYGGNVSTFYPVVQYATRASQFQHRLPYPNYLGGVVGFLPEAYRRINGFSNKFWGWGGEDDDLYRRVKTHHLEVGHATTGRFLSAEHPRPPRINHLYQNNVRVLSRPIHPIDGLENALSYCASVVPTRVSDAELHLRVDPVEMRRHVSRIRHTHARIGRHLSQVRGDADTRGTSRTVHVDDPIHRKDVKVRVEYGK